jgi:tyrosyl-tRNA synthetase
MTGGIGDPSGKSIDRPLLSERNLDENVAGLTNDIMQFKTNSENILEKQDTTPGDLPRGMIINNIDHYTGMTVADFFVGIGRHMRVSSMLARDSVASRLQSSGSGLSLTEFSYQAFQAFDFAQLNRNHSAGLQVGGSDQWGNICAGIDLTSRLESQTVCGLTVPLLTTPSGDKFGKSAGNAVWLDPRKTNNVSAS